MNIKWWVWIGIAIILFGAYSLSGLRLATMAEVNVSEGYGLSTIGYALSHFPSMFMFLCASLMIFFFQLKNKFIQTDPLLE